MSETPDYQDAVHLSRIWRSFQEEVDPNIPGERVFAGFRGSLAHGSATEDPFGSSTEPDVDVVCVHRFRPHDYYGVDGVEEDWRIQEGSGWDVVSYDIRKFLRMLCQANPNLHQLLYLPDGMRLLHPAFRVVIDTRSCFLSRELYGAYRGYARSTEREFEESIDGAQGYDGRLAGHVVRLLEMGNQLLRYGGLTIPRPEAKLLREIRRCEPRLEEVRERHERLFRRLADAHRLSALPDTADRLVASELSRAVIEHEV